MPRWMTSLLLSAILSASTHAGEPPSTAPSTQPMAESVDRSAAQAALQRLENATDWRAEAAASKELAEMGESAVSVVSNAAHRHEKVAVRRACYALLNGAFAEYPQALSTVANQGLRDSDPAIRYDCAFQLGQHKAYGAHQELRRLMEREDSDEYTRIAAAKSLAQLGEGSVLRTLYIGLGHDRYMPRYMANLGIKALSGKDLNDFEGYNYGEGAFVSGGVEAIWTDLNAIDDAHQKALRFKAMESYFRWLQKEHPELYKFVSPGL